MTLRKPMRMSERSAHIMDLKPSTVSFSVNSRRGDRRGGPLYRQHNSQPSELRVKVRTTRLEYISFAYHPIVTIQRTSQFGSGFMERTILSLMVFLPRHLLGAALEEGNLGVSRISSIL